MRAYLLLFTLFWPLSIAAQTSFQIGPNFKVASSQTTALTLTGDWVNSGEFDGNAIFNGTTPQQIISPDPETFRQLTIDNPTTVTLTANIFVEEELSLLQGQLDNTDNAITLSDSALFDQQNGEIANVPEFTGLINLAFRGTEPMSLGDRLPEGVREVGRILIGNPAGVTLDRSITIHRDLTFESGKLFTSSEDTVTLAGTVADADPMPGGRVIGEAEGSYLVGNLYVRRFVCGNADDFGGLGLRINSGATDIGYVSVLRVTGLLAERFIFNQPSILRYWQIAADRPSVNDRQLTFAWVSDDDNGLDLSQAQIWRTDDNSAWRSAGFVGDAAVSRTITAPTRTFSTWTVKSYQPSGFSGDLDGDFRSDEWDVALIAHYVLFEFGLINSQKILADQDGNGVLDILDVISLADRPR